MEQSLERGWTGHGVMDGNATSPRHRGLTVLGSSLDSSYLCCDLDQNMSTLQRTGKVSEEL